MSEDGKLRREKEIGRSGDQGIRRSGDRISGDRGERCEGWPNFVECFACYRVGFVQEYHEVLRAPYLSSLKERLYDI